MALLEGIPAPLTPAAATKVLVLRNYVVYKGAWKLFITGFLEPVFYLFSIGIGVGQLIDTFEFHGEAIPYAEFVAPAMLATSAFNGALLDSTYNVFFKMKYEKLYDQMLATPLSTGDIARGEITWGLMRGSVYSAAFLVVMALMGLTQSWWAVLALPAAILIAFAFSAVCMARDDVDDELAGLRQDHARADAAVPVLGHVLPDRGVRRRGLRWVVEATPLYRGVVLCRELTTGVITWESAVSVVYLVVMGVVGLLVVRRRLDKLLLT